MLTLFRCQKVLQARDAFHYALFWTKITDQNFCDPRHDGLAECEQKMLSIANRNGSILIYLVIWKWQCYPPKTSDKSHDINGCGTISDNSYIFGVIRTVWSNVRHMSMGWSSQLQILSTMMLSQSARLWPELEVQTTGWGLMSQSKRLSARKTGLCTAQLCNECKTSSRLCPVGVTSNDSAVK
jgi:hypothetical protein